MSRRLRPQGLTSLSSSMPDDQDYEKLDSKSRDNAVLAGCGITPRISLEEVADGPTTDQDKKGHRRAVSSFSFARQLQAAVPIASHDDEINNIASPTSDSEHSFSKEIHVLADPEKGTTTSSPIDNPPTPFLPTRRTATHSANKAKLDREIWRMLLLNMYPVTYLILWIPGIANRIAEGMGHEVRTLVILQSSTQFIGLANASVYVYKEHRRDVREWWAGVKGRKAARGEKVVSDDGGSGRVRYWGSVGG